MKISPVLFICLLGWLLLPGAGHALDLTIYCEYPPPSTDIGPGSKGGVIHDLVNELRRRTGIERPVQQVTWKRGYEEAISLPNIGLFPTTRTPEREELFSWVGPILQVEWAFFGLRDSGVVINSLEDAKKVKAIGTYANDVKHQWLEAHGFTNLVPVLENQTNVKKLYNKRIDIMAGSPTVTDRWPTQYGLDPARMVMLYTFRKADLYLALSLGTSTETVRTLQKAYAEMTKDGTVRDIYMRWLPGVEPPEK